MAGHIPFRKADAWLRATRSIWLASAGVDGTPHAAPVWFAWDGRSIYFCTEPTTVKHANLSDPVLYPEYRSVELEWHWLHKRLHALGGCACPGA